MYNKLFMNFLKQNEPTCNCYTKQVYTRAHDSVTGVGAGLGKIYCVLKIDRQIPAK